MHGFDGYIPGTISINQDSLIMDKYINFDYWAGWNMLDISPVVGNMPRRIDVKIQDVDSSAILYKQNILLANPGTKHLDSEYLTASIDVSAFINQTIRFRIDSTVPESLTGPAFVTFDNFRSSSSPVPEPSSMLLLGAGLAEIFFIHT